MSKRLTTPADLEQAIAWRLRSKSGSAWSFVCAKQAQQARSAGVVDIFWGAGLEVLQAYQASRRGQAERKGDALTQLLTAYFSNNPDATSAEAYDHCAVLADMRVAPFEDFADGGGLAYEPEPGAALEDIGRDAFMQRARRVQKKSTNHRSSRTR